MSNSDFIDNSELYLLHIHIRNVLPVYRYLLYQTEAVFLIKFVGAFHFLAGNDFVAKVFSGLRLTAYRHNRRHRGG